MNFRKQMTPGMEKCKKKYGKDSPYKAADASLIAGQKQVAENAMDAVAGGTTTTEKLAKIGQEQTDKYAGKDEVNFEDYGLNTDEQIQKNLSV